jgi:hypothetical protein
MLPHPPGGTDDDEDDDACGGGLLIRSQCGLCGGEFVAVAECWMRATRCCLKREQQRMKSTSPLKPLVCINYLLAVGTLTMRLGSSGHLKCGDTCRTCIDESRVTSHESQVTSHE